jgi:hypothetical protein
MVNQSTKKCNTVRQYMRRMLLFPVAVILIFQQTTMLLVHSKMKMKVKMSTDMQYVEKGREETLQG